MTAEPVIGVCAVRERARWAFWDQPAHLVADTYVSSIARAGGIPVLLPVDPRLPVALLDRLDALVLIGGADVDPVSYGAERAPATEATYLERDEFEIAMLTGGLERALPVLAICRGMQIMNVALGGTLQQDLVTANGEHPHRRVVGSFEGTDHQVTLVPGSLAERAAGERRHVIHCHHHQAIGRLGTGLAITGVASDGVPEAIEPADGRWALGVQWHPEVNERTRLFQALVQASSRR